MDWIWVGLGGGLGSVLRFWLQGRLQAAFPGLFPVGTLGVNLIGSGIIGFLAWIFVSGGPANATTAHPHLRLFLMVGVLGGFTTFSSFSLENMQLLREGEGRLAAMYMVGSNVLGVGCAFGGFMLARALFRSGQGL